MPSLRPDDANPLDIITTRDPMALPRRDVRACAARIALVGALACPLTPLHAQQSDSPPSLERVRVALQRPQSLSGAVIPPEPEERRLGPLTFAPPKTRGEFVRVRVPVGALVGRLTHSIAAAHHRRAEEPRGRKWREYGQSFRKHCRSEIIRCGLTASSSSMAPHGPEAATC